MASNGLGRPGKDLGGASVFAVTGNQEEGVAAQSLGLLNRFDRQPQCLIRRRRVGVPGFPVIAADGAIDQNPGLFDCFEKIRFLIGHQWNVRFDAFKAAILCNFKLFQHRLTVPDHAVLQSFAKWQGGGDGEGFGAKRNGCHR